MACEKGGCSPNVKLSTFRNGIGESIQVKPEIDWKDQGESTDRETSWLFFNNGQLVFQTSFQYHLGVFDGISSSTNTCLNIAGGSRELNAYLANNIAEYNSLDYENITIAIEVKNSNCKTTQSNQIRVYEAIRFAPRINIDTNNLIELCEGDFLELCEGDFLELC